MKKIFTYAILFFFTLLTSVLRAQTIKGTIKDQSQTLIGATIKVDGQALGTTTDANGNYSLNVKAGSYRIIASYAGYESSSKNITVSQGETVNLDFVLNQLGNLNEVVVIGSRSRPRSQLNTPVPVDVVDIKKISRDGPQVSLNQILNYVAPSFSSNIQTISDGTDHIDPASLRGLGPDQVLVLINGKRRHTTSLININGSFGKGSVGTDLNAIPTAAIKRVEILRDGASAQYGSDAIAGVINIILDDQVNVLTGSVTTGGYASKNTEGDKTFDGGQVQANLNYGVPLGKNGGYVNVAGSYDYRDYTNRMKAYTGTIYTDYNDPALATIPGTPTGKDITDAELAKRGQTRSDFNSRVGQSANRGGSLFFNSSVPVSVDAEVYAFGGLNYRHGESAAFFRTPSQLTQTNASIYPNGFLPLIVTDNSDKSLATGIRGKLGEWKVDLSNTYGQNTLNFTTDNSLNASLLSSSPTSFTDGGYGFIQNTTNLDLSRFYKDVLSGLNLAFGAEHRYENYKINAGSDESYVNYGNALNVGTDANGKPILIPNPQGNVSTLFAANGAALAGGAQGFPGFSPANVVNASRTAVAAYADGEINFTKALLVDGAVRFENYSDFGSTVNWKVASSYKFSDKFLLRGAASTGFRAPSLQQRYFSATSTIFANGQFVESGTFRNDSRIAQLLGIPKLKQETSKNYSLGFTSNLGDLKITVDGYYIRINDRVIYTGQFTGSATGTAQDVEIYNILHNANATSARFFANAIDTRTRGIDAVITYSKQLGQGAFRADLSGTYAKTDLVGKIHASPLLAGKESTYFDAASTIYLESAVPQSKINLSLNYNLGKWNFFWRDVYFGKVTEATNVVTAQDVYKGKTVSDVSVGYELYKALRLTIGANNVFDIYPDPTSVANQSSGRFLYSRTAQQFGFNGRFLFARVSFNL
ncbi:TonB-dependent receptor [Mucilaginibacter sp. FT3.2]|uniref:TonB-dependent receptor n=1 Tax=Mucilaginibacter sp. FT3.2 TaxID=2723090 RepID=UPI0016161274|nr:TonB-dependent receptor [Mucilaginibacter sp. FT3.2]MBB6233846.1 iron complex outermembrane receptor protein [Mucilaginibacter sp. FT3.2]